jgi:hypothetical protein
MLADSVNDGDHESCGSLSNKALEAAWQHKAVLRGESLPLGHLAYGRRLETSEGSSLATCAQGLSAEMQD